MPQQLPYCEYPKATDAASHGLQQLSDKLPLVTLNKVQQYRSKNFKPVSTEAFDGKQFLQLLKVIAESFAINEPMARHLVPPKECPSKIAGLTHNDPLGNDEFGEWTKENILYWIFRLFFVTDAESPLDEISIHQNAIKQSLAVLNDDGKIIGGAVNVNLSTPDKSPSFRNNDPFIKAVMPFFEPVYYVIGRQMDLSLNALCNAFPEFKTALQNNKVGDLNLIARSPELPTEDTFELVAATVERFQELGFKYIIISAANQWTGAACEVLGAVRVHFSPFRVLKLIDESAEAVEGITSSTDGFISDKDSGCSLYVIRLQ